jgi:5-methylcytosine-specific restriction endonuclease McrA
MVIFNPVIVSSLKVAALKTDINPYIDKEYFENRYKIIDVDKFRKAIYARQKYKCAACNEILGNDEQIELHHIIPRSKGGKYTLKNIVAVHKTCHESITFAYKQH